MTDDRPDLPRNREGTALVGGPRNDENHIRSQSQYPMLHVHDRISEWLPENTEHRFERPQQLACWHCRWLVLEECLPTVCGPAVVEVVRGERRRFTVGHDDEAYTPLPLEVEFADAAYRFGHSQARLRYRIVAEVIVGLIDSDPRSFLAVQPGRTPTLPAPCAGGSDERLRLRRGPPRVGLRRGETGCRPVSRPDGWAYYYPATITLGMFDDTNRRRFLQLAGTGTALSMAGCSAISEQMGDDAEGSGDDSAEPVTVTLGVQPDEESLQELQSDIQSRVESGELSRTEAQAEFREGQTELTADAVETFQNRTGNVSVSVDDSVNQFGVVLISGAPSALIETLSFDEVSGLFPASVFEEARTQSEGAAGGTGTETG
ncbi:hypothetical protein [Haloplanus sp.]|uniref:hypothetical protein n=1 Tax=Haloplanus sp. TaxID=1961696 RepID=UPI002608462E|nr:hypothetical protein [Haloplanus sp.]